MLYSDLFSNALSLFKDENRTLDLQLVMEEAFNLTRTQYWLKKNEHITDLAGLRKFYRYRERLLKNEPIAYILKRKEFYGETFYVNRNVLIPRPETEILVEHALRLIGLMEGPAAVLDIGAGSGVIAIMLAKRAGAIVTAVDNSREARYILKKNIAFHHVKEKVMPSYGDLFPPFPAKFHMIVSNPPYVSEKEWKGLDAAIKNHEPKHALVADQQGLAIIKRIIEGCPGYLEPGGELLMEIGYNQKQPVADMLIEKGFSSIEFFNDYSGIPRVAYGSLL